MEKVKVDNPRMLFDRYEQLKRKYFEKQRPDTEDYINPLPRSVIIKQFEKMGCEIPLSPDQPFTPLDYVPED